MTNINEICMSLLRAWVCWSACNSATLRRRIELLEDKEDK